MPVELVWIAAGGAAGSVARHLVAIWLDRGAKTPFPPTLAVNLLGSFLTALVVQIATARGAMDSLPRLVLTAGVLGGFTTYSAFNQETIVLLRQGAWGTALANVGLTLAGCLAAGFLGLFIGRFVAR